MHSGNGNRDRKSFLMFEHLTTSLPGEGPRGDDSDLGNEKDGTSDDSFAQVNAHSHR